MRFSLNPPCGYSGTYLDIQFNVEFDQSDKAEIRLINKTSGDNLDILAVSKGYIRNEKIAIIDNSYAMDGYFNLFNKDKRALYV